MSGLIKPHITWQSNNINTMHLHVQLPCLSTRILQMQIARGRRSNPKSKQFTNGPNLSVTDFQDINTFHIFCYAKPIIYLCARGSKLGRSPISPNQVLTHAARAAAKQPFQAPLVAAAKGSGQSKSPIAPVPPGLVKPA